MKNDGSKNMNYLCLLCKRILGSEEMKIYRTMDYEQRNITNRKEGICEDCYEGYSMIFKSLINKVKIGSSQ